MRGQSPAAAQQASFGYKGTVHELAEDHFHGRDVTHYTVDSNAAQAAGYWGGGAGCPSGACPPGGPGCPSGGCPGGGCGPGGHPHHGYSFSYDRPNDLVYPPANVPGGAVVYPYYTLRGPSDFFRAR
jgi:hypothetical protein